jgi:hypothetical protein
MNKMFRGATLVVALINVSIVTALAQGTAFTYQGQLDDSGSLANGTFDLKLTLFDAATNGNTVAGPVTNTAVGVTNGLFTTTVDFAAVGGGANNNASGPGAFVGGGGWDDNNYVGNVASGAASTVAGGVNNGAANFHGTVGGGANNR